MIDAVWLLSSRGLLDYAKAATTWLLTRMRRDETEASLRPASQPTPDDLKSLRSINLR
jgi:hypothetical protein